MHGPGLSRQGLGVYSVDALPIHGAVLDFIPAARNEHKLRLPACTRGLGSCALVSSAVTASSVDRAFQHAVCGLDAELLEL